MEVKIHASSEDSHYKAFEDIPFLHPLDTKGSGRCESFP